MTADEFASAPTLPDKIAWMACHFSPYSTSLSNLPPKLPPDSLLILNDSTPPGHQDPAEIAKELENTLKIWNCSGILLDFQRPVCDLSMRIIKQLLELDCPVCISEGYAKELDCPVFLPPPPITTPLEEYIAPWKDREIWLDTALNCAQITVTKSGSAVLPISDRPEYPFADEALHCHYHIALKDDAVIFSLQRTKDDLDALLKEAENLGITSAVGLYQELK